MVYRDNILIYIKEIGQAHIDAVCWVPNELRKHGLFGNLKKCHFDKDEVWFLSYIVSAQKVKIEDE